MAEKKRGKPWGLAVFYPDSYLDSTYEIDFDGLYRQGYRGLILILTIRWCRTGRRRTRGRSNCLPI